MLIILLLIYLLFPCQIFAIPSVVINSVPDVITAGTTFPVSFTVNEASSSSTYYYKFFGGVDNDVYKITNNQDLSYSSGWSNFPQIILNPSSQNIFNGYAFIKPEVETSTLNLKIRIALSTDTNTKLGATSPVFLIDVVAIPPTLVPTPTDFPKPTNTPNPTNTPTIIPTKIPTLTKTPTSTPTETPEISPLYQGEMLEGQGVFDPILTPTLIPVLGVTINSNKKNYLPLIFICLGALFLLTPLIIAKIKHEK